MTIISTHRLDTEITPDGATATDGMFNLTADLYQPGGPLEWQVDALCAQVDPEMFYPEKGGSTRDAKSICDRCTVRAECLEYALGHDERFGIWGGLSERERRRLKRSVSGGGLALAADEAA